ncbi:MAG: hypothetical protein QME32_05260 [Endomicrobiia bacterium]|nr:hypothetical protein [Endomicrobiia bacterium]
MMYRLFRLLSCIALAAFVGASALYAVSANAPWGDPAQIQVGAVIQSGVSISAWAGEGGGDQRGDITGNTTSFHTPTTQMTAIGDGTYQFRTDLVPGAVYNYIFGARILQNAWGFAAGSDYAEPIPDGTQQDDAGNYSNSDPGTFVSLSSTAYSATGDGGVSYISISGAARRRLDMPSVDPGTTIYVFNNFGSLPRGVANYSVRISSGRLDLNWQGALGTWGAGMPSVDALGGRNLLYVSTSNSAGPYSLLANLAGTVTYYAHSGLANGTSYYFIFVSSDPYAGVTRSTYTASKSLWANLSRGIPPAGTSWNTDGYAHNDKYGKPSGPVPVYFKVENIDEKYVAAHGDIVYLTPWDEDGRLYRNKIPGLFLAVYVPKG